MGREEPKYIYVFIETDNLGWATVKTFKDEEKADVFAEEWILNHLQDEVELDEYEDISELIDLANSHPDGYNFYMELSKIVY